jgi:hypothetical protein
MLRREFPELANQLLLPFMADLYYQILRVSPPGLGARPASIRPGNHEEKPYQGSSHICSFASSIEIKPSGNVAKATSHIRN